MELLGCSVRRSLEQDWLLAELHRSVRLGLDELARRFDRSVSWVADWGWFRNCPSLSSTCPQWEDGAHAAMKYLVPLARVKRYDCERLALEIVPESVWPRKWACSMRTTSTFLQAPGSF